MPGNLFLKTCTPELHSNSRSRPERLPRTHSPWLILCQNYLRMYALGKGLVELLTTLRYSFYLFSAASWEVYKVLPKLVRGVLFLPASDVYVRSFLCPVTLNKILHTKLWVTETLSLVLELNLLLWRPWIWRHCSPFTVSYQDSPGKNTGGGCHFLLQGGCLASLESFKKLLLYFSVL